MIAEQDTGSKGGPDWIKSLLHGCNNRDSQNMEAVVNIQIIMKSNPAIHFLSYFISFVQSTFPALLLLARLRLVTYKHYTDRLTTAFTKEDCLVIQ